MSPDGDAFLKAVADNPADEAPRLAFADWLQGRGDEARAAFARLSADFLRCVRGLADLRRAHPPEWLEVMDPLFNRFYLIRLPDLGPGVSRAWVADIFVTPGGSVLKGQVTFNLAVEPRTQYQLRGEESGLVTAVFVRPGETVAVDQPLFAYAAGSEKFVLRTPRAPMLEFIRSLENQRRTLRQNSKELNEAMLARHATALDIIFGAEAVRTAYEVAQRDLGRSPHGVTAEEWAQARIDIHIRALQVLLARHGQPDGFTTPPARPGGTPSA